MVSLLFGTGASVAQAPTNPTSYVGIWKMTAQDKRVGTLELMNYNGRLTGSITNAHATMDSNESCLSLSLFRVRLLLSNSCSMPKPRALPGAG